MKIVHWKNIYNFFFNLSSMCHASTMSHNMSFCVSFLLGAKLVNKLCEHYECLSYCMPLCRKSVAKFFFVLLEGICCPA